MVQSPPGLQYRAEASVFLDGLPTRRTLLTLVTCRHFPGYKAQGTHAKLPPVDHAALTLGRAFRLPTRALDPNKGVLDSLSGGCIVIVECQLCPGHFPVSFLR